MILQGLWFTGVYTFTVGLAWLAWRVASHVTGWPEMTFAQVEVGVFLVWLLCFLFQCATEAKTK